MSTLQFKLMHEKRMYRFTPTRSGDEILKDINERVREIVKVTDYKLFWNGKITENGVIEFSTPVAAAIQSQRASKRAAVPPPSTPSSSPFCSSTKPPAPTRFRFASPLKIKNMFQALSEIMDGEDTHAVEALVEDVQSKITLKSLLESHQNNLEEDDRIENIIVHHSTCPEDHQQRWLMLENNGNDCFLNAALQYMKRARDLRNALEKRKPNIYLTVEQHRKETVLRSLAEILSTDGTVNPRIFRNSLPTVIKGLEPAFLNTQQDAYEILTKIFDDVIPEDIAKQFMIKSSRRRRCRDNVDCEGSEKNDSGAIHYHHISSKNQVVDLEAHLSDEWTEVEGENEPRHCSACCVCCIIEDPDHDEDTCEECKRNKTDYVEEQRFRFKGSSNYALIAFNILHAEERVDWAIEWTCNMDEMYPMGHTWKAASLIKHIGHAMANWSSGHYVAYTKDDGQWWLHNDDSMPVSIGRSYDLSSGYPYPNGTTDMEGVLAILFEKID